MQARTTIVMAQKELFENEGLGIQLSAAQVKILRVNLNGVSHDDNNENITLDTNKKLNDWIEAKF
jgi:hypothetical protein